MSLVGLQSRDRAEETRALKARVALGVKILTNAGYAMIGGTFFKAIGEQRAISGGSYVWAGAGIAVLIYALMLAPYGADQDG
jgi:hypothetical protein